MGSDAPAAAVAVPVSDRIRLAPVDSRIVPAAAGAMRSSVRSVFSRRTFSKGGSQTLARSGVWDVATNVARGGQANRGSVEPLAELPVLLLVTQEVAATETHIADDHVAGIDRRGVAADADAVAGGALAGEVEAGLGDHDGRLERDRAGDGESRGAAQPLATG